MPSDVKSSVWIAAGGQTYLIHYTFNLVILCCDANEEFSRAVQYFDGRLDKHQILFVNTLGYPHGKLEFYHGTSLNIQRSSTID